MGKNEKDSTSRALIINVLLLIVGLGIAYGAFIGIELAYTSDAPLRVVISGSMIPKYQIGDVVVVKGVGPQIVPILFFSVPVNGADASTIKNGSDIIFWYAPYSLVDPIVHRVQQVILKSSLCGGDVEFITHGINNNPVITEWACGSMTDGQPNYVIGVVAGSIPYVGYVSQFLKSEVGIILVITLIGILLAIEILEPEKEETETATNSSSRL